MVALDDIKNLTPQERLEVFAKINSKDLELIMHHCSVELQERELVEDKMAFKEHLEDNIVEEAHPNNETNPFLEDDELLGTLTAEERRIWL